MMKTIFIVDDQTGIRLLLEEVIRNEGYQAKSFEDGLSAIEEIEKNKPNLLIIDHQLPIKSGAEIITILEKKAYNIPTIVMSGLVESAKTNTEKNKTVKAYFSKPFNIVDARRIINQLLEGNKWNKQLITPFKYFFPLKQMKLLNIYVVTAYIWLVLLHVSIEIGMLLE